MLGCMCQQIGLPWLKTLISSNTFLTHMKGSSTQLISPSSVKSFQFSAPHLGGISPLLVSSLGSMFHPLRLGESLILLVHSFGPGSQNISCTFIPLLPFYYFPHRLFSTSRDIKEKPSPKGLHKPISFSSPARAPLIMKHQERPTNPNPPSTFTSPVESNMGLFICLQNSTSKEVGQGACD